jgi:pimeloyl-ACP methyl ester carboxylesterase
MNPTITPYKIDIPEAQLTDLRDRLTRTRWPEPLLSSPERDDWLLGTEQTWLQEICNYWRDEYDWRKAEARLNQYEQGMLSVKGEQMHFLHVRSRHAGAQPIIITHGWGGSIIEHLDLLDRLVDPPAFGGSADDAYHVVVPSMPGYGFSGPTRHHGFTCFDVADANAGLMQALGYDRYIAQGGDWGSLVTRRMGVKYGDRLSGVHFNMLFAQPNEGEEHLFELLTDEDRASFESVGQRMTDGVGYMDIMWTKPESLTYAQTDSPAGLAGWILEKFEAWVDHDGDLYDVLSRDQLLTNLMVYWLPNSVSSSARLYYESKKAGQHATDPWHDHIDVPTGYALYPHEMIQTPRAWAEKRYQIVHWEKQVRGGHFAAFEQPDLFATDLWKFGRTIRGIEDKR